MREKMQQNSEAAGTSCTIAQAEALECRRLLAGIEAGILVARGTEAADVISLRRNGADNVMVTTNGVNQIFDMDDFTGVRLEGLGGDDRFDLIDPLISPDVRHTTVYGGAGSDTVSYAARTHDLSIGGYFEPGGFGDRAGRMLLPFLMASAGVQSDRLASDVETVIGSSDRDFAELLGWQGGDRWTEQFGPRPELQIDGGHGDDRLGIEQLTATLLGGAGDDLFFAQESGIDHILAGAGDDAIVLRNGGIPDSLDAGPGRDLISAWGSTRGTIDASGFEGLEDILYVNFPTRLVIGNDLDNHITTRRDGADGVTLRGGGGNDTLEGGAAREVLHGEGGNDSLVGGFGVDTLDGGNGFDIADGGPGINAYGNVEIVPAAPRIRIVDRVLIADGSWGVDLIEVERAGSDAITVRVNESSATFNTVEFDGILLHGNNGFDQIRVLDGNVNTSFLRPVTLVGGNGDDTLEGSGGDDVLLGGDGDDEVYGHDGKDSLVGAFGRDYLNGGSGGPDTVDGGPGDDAIWNAEAVPPPPSIGIVDRVLIADGSWGVDLLTIEPVAGDDDVIVRVTDTVRRFDTDDFDGVLLRGQQGFDYLQVLQPIPGLKVTLEGGNGYDTLLGSGGEEVLRGGTGNDLLRGFGGNDALFGNGGRDLLDAGGGDDFLEALDGQSFDTLFGGDGNDTALVDSGDQFSGVETFA